MCFTICFSVSWCIQIKQTAPWSTYTVMEGGFLEVSVEAVCSGGVTVFLNHTSPGSAIFLPLSVFSKFECSCVDRNVGLKPFVHIWTELMSVYLFAH